MIGKKRSSLYRVNWTLHCTQDHIINIFTTLLWKRIIMYDNVVKMLIIWFCVHLRVQFTSQSEASFYLSSNYICVQIQKRKYLQEFKPVSIQSYIAITFTTERYLILHHLSFCFPALNYEKHQMSLITPFPAIPCKKLTPLIIQETQPIMIKWRDFSKCWNPFFSIV